MAHEHSNLKARQVQDLLREHGFERGVVKCIEALADYQAVIREGQVEMAQMLNQAADTLANFVAVADNLKTAQQRLENKDKMMDHNGEMKQ